MKKIIFMFGLLNLMFLNPVMHIYSQSETQDKSDTLITGGKYRFVLNSGKIIAGEYTGKRDSTFLILSSDELFDLKKNEIKSIEIQRSLSSNKEFRDIRPVPRENKFRMLGSIQTGFAIPTGNFGDIYSTSSGFQISAYELFSGVTGLGFEIQYNNFHGPETRYYEYTYYYQKYEFGDYNSSMLKLNFMFGNLNPKSIIVFYGLLGVGLQLNNVGEYMNSTVYNNSTYEYKSDGESGFSFIYGAGAGTFLKTSKKIGINLEFQYNRISGLSNGDYYYYGDSDGGFFTVKAGIMYTNF